MDDGRYFLHGLDSSSQGTKGRWFGERFPEMIIPDFTGTLEQRLQQLEQICGDSKSMLFVGSSFGGLMATLFAQRYPLACSRLILLAPALNFEGYTPPAERLTVPTMVVIGKDDTVTPPDLVVPLAEQTFAHLDISVVDDDHMLHGVFTKMDWTRLLMET